MLLNYYYLCVKLLLKSLYDVTLSKILREYDRVIVNSKKIVDLNNEKEIIDVNSFTELLDVRDNLEKPIIFSLKFIKDKKECVHC